MKIIEVNAGNFKDPVYMKLLLQILEIQKENDREADPDKNSFLVTLWSEEELISLATRGSVFYMAVEGDLLIGYFVVSSLLDFLKQLDSAQSHDFDKAVLNNGKPWAYLYQMAVRRTHQKRGVNSKIFSELKLSRSGASYVSDYMIAPWCNEGSSKAFEKYNFKKAGQMFLDDYRGVDSTQWQIVILD
jgi:hypothetical protein